MTQPNGAMANQDVSEGYGSDVREEYDRGREERLEAQNTTQELGESRELRGGAVVTGTSPTMLQTQFPGAALRGLAENENAGGVAARAAKGLATDDVIADGDTSWTAQSARPFLEANAQDVPGQTFRAEELPDPLVVNASNLPSHTIPSGLVVDVEVKTDNLNTSQEGGDLGTGPREAQAPAPQAAASKTGDTKVGSKQDKQDSTPGK